MTNYKVIVDYNFDPTSTVTRFEEVHQVRVSVKEAETK